MNSKAPLFTGIALLLVGLGLVVIGLMVPLTAAAGRPTCLAVGAFVAGTGLFTLLTRRWLGSLLLTLLVLSFGALVFGAIEDDGVLAGAGLICLVVTGAAAAVTMQLGERTGTPTQERVAAPPVSPAFEEILRRIHDHTMLSESAKRVLFRERELDMLRAAIESDIRRGDYNAALRLCDDMADLFGFRQEAETFRGRLDETRRADSDAQVAAAMEQLDAMLAERNWAAAHDIAGRIRRLFPETHAVEGLDGRIERAREEHKHELEEQFLEAANREDVELAMDRLRELDRYLQRDEASRIAEVAQGIVAKHKDNLSVQFKLAVNGHEWDVAARIGESIMREFPNTKMAEEVSSMIDVIRTRATQAAVASEEP